MEVPKRKVTLHTQIIHGLTKTHERKTGRNKNKKPTTH